MYLAATGAMPPVTTPDISPNSATPAVASTAPPDATRPAESVEQNHNPNAEDIAKKDAASDRITVSDGGRILSKSGDRGKDAVTQAIEDSKYPDEIKKLMIKIRELQQQLRDKAKELQQVTADQQLPARQREMKVSAIRDAVGTIASAIRAATTTLNDTMTVMRMSSDDRKEIATLISA